MSKQHWCLTGKPQESREDSVENFEHKMKINVNNLVNIIKKSLPEVKYMGRENILHSIH